MAYAEKFRIFVASSGEEGLRILREEHRHIGIVVSDQRMPEMKGADVLGVAREEFPGIVRILTTAYSDLDDAILAVNKGFIYQYVVKPWDITEFGMVLQRAADYFQVLSERDGLLSLKMTTLQRIICGDRVRWLLTSLPEGADGQSTRTGLTAMLRAMPASLQPVAGQLSRAMASEFRLETLLSRELSNARAVQTWLATPWNALPALAVPGLDGLDGTTRRAVEVFAGAVNTAQSSSVSAGGMDDTITLEIGVRAGFEKCWNMVQSLFGLLMQSEPPATSVLLLRLLSDLSVQNKNLRLILTSESTADDPILLSFETHGAGTITSDAVIGALCEKFSSWDIARL